MALVASRVRIPGTGELIVAAVGTAAPEDPTTAITAGVGLGYTEDGGVTLARSMDREGVEVWQSVTPVKYIYNGLELTVSAALVQSENEVASLWWGGDFAETEVASGIFKSDLSTIPTSVERAVGLKWTDDEDASHMIWLPRAEISETGDVEISRNATAFQITFAALPPDTGEVLATWLTDDPNFAPPTP